MIAVTTSSSSSTSSGRRPARSICRGKQVPVGDEHLLVVGVSVETDEVHPVEQWRRDRVGHVGRGEEHHLGQIEVDFEVVVAERVVLGGIEDLEQRRGRIARPPAGRELVDLVEQDDRVHRARLLQRPHEASGLRADIGAAVAADLGLVANAAERHAHELAAHRPGDRFAEAGLADAGRPDEGDDRSFATRGADPVGVWSLVDAAVVAQLAGGEELDDAVLHVAEAVVIGVEHRSCFDEVELVLAALAPRQFEDAIEPRAHPGVLRGLFAHPLEPIEFLGDRRLHAVGRVEVVELGAEFADDVVCTLAELLADRVELLAQEPLALLLVDALAHVVTDRLRHLEFGQMVPGPRVDGVDAVGQVHGAQHDEAIGVGELRPRGHRVSERSRCALGAQDLGEAA